jgi:hypothetical protein
MNWKRGAGKWSRPFRALSRNLPKIRKTKKQPSVRVSDILTASLPKRTPARSVWQVKLQLDQLIAGGSGQPFLTSAQHAGSPSGADPGSSSPGERESLVPFKVGGVCHDPQGRFQRLGTRKISCPSGTRILNAWSSSSQSSHYTDWANCTDVNLYSFFSTLFQSSSLASCLAVKWPEHQANVSWLMEYDVLPPRPRMSSRYAA